MFVAVEGAGADSDAHADEHQYDEHPEHALVPGLPPGGDRPTFGLGGLSGCAGGLRPHDAR